MIKQNSALLELSQELENYSQEIAKQLAIETRERLYKEADNAISDFYGHYDPLYYKRHQPIGYNIRKSFRKYYHAPHGNIFSGGIEMSSDWMDDIYRYDKDYIATLIYSGFHGNVLMFPFKVSNVPPIMSPSPIGRILEARDDIVKNISKIANPISAKIRQTGNYKYIKWSEVDVWEIARK